MWATGVLTIFIQNKVTFSKDAYTAVCCTCHCLLFGFFVRLNKKKEVERVLSTSECHRMHVHRFNARVYFVDWRGHFVCLRENYSRFYITEHVVCITRKMSVRELYGKFTRYISTQTRKHNDFTNCVYRCWSRKVSNYTWLLDNSDKPDSGVFLHCTW